jgi:hypothetical protein
MFRSVLSRLRKAVAEAQSLLARALARHDRVMQFYIL